MIKLLKKIFRSHPKMQDGIFEVGNLSMSVEVYFLGRAVNSFHYPKKDYCHNEGDYICGKSVVKFRAKNIFESTSYPFPTPWRYALIPEHIKLELISDGNKKGTIPIQAFEVSMIMLLPQQSTPETYPSKHILPGGFSDYGLDGEQK